MISFSTRGTLSPFSGCAGAVSASQEGRASSPKFPSLQLNLCHTLHSSQILPWHYYHFFTFVEPALTIGGAVYAIFSPRRYHLELIPSLVMAGPITSHPASIMAIRQLGSCEHPKQRQGPGKALTCPILLRANADRLLPPRHARSNRVSQDVQRAEESSCAVRADRARVSALLGYCRLDGMLPSLLLRIEGSLM